MRRNVRANAFLNCDITIDDINRGKDINGKAVPELKGKMKRKEPQCRAKVLRQPLPSPLQDVSLHIFVDIVYINKLVFFISKTKAVNYIKVTALKSRSMTQLIDAMIDHIDLYEMQGLEISGVHGDYEFQFSDFERSVRSSLLHKYAKEEHVGFIENCNKMFKERGHAITNGIPYQYYLKLMIISLAEHIVDLLNSFLSKHSVSETMGPAEIVEGTTKIDLKQNRLPYGAYAQVWIGTKNNMTECCIPGIALRASNRKGGFYFMSLYSGKRIHSYIWEELPISDEIIERVEQLAIEQKQPKLIDGVPLFEWDYNRNVTNNNDDDDEEEDAQDAQNEDQDDAEDAADEEEQEANEEEEDPINQDEHVENNEDPYPPEDNIVLLLLGWSSSFCKGKSAASSISIMGWFGCHSKRRMQSAKVGMP